MLSKFGLPLVSLGMIIFALTHVFSQQKTPPKLEPLVTPPRSPFGKTIAASGLVEPETENIMIGTAVPGVIETVHVEVNKKVKKGDPLFTVDTRSLAAQKKSREADLDFARSQLKKLDAMPREEELPVKEARLQEAKANLLDQELLWKRAQEIYASSGRSGVMSDEDYTRRRQNYFVAKQQEIASQADLQLLKAGAWAPDKDIAKANVKQMEAQLKMIETELERLIVRASVDGEVLQVNVRPGEFVGNAMNNSSSYIVLGNVDKLHLRVDIDEHDIPRLRPDCPAKAYARGDTKTAYTLRFIRIEPFVVPKKSLTGNTAERIDTRVLQVIYAVENAKQGSSRLFVGQQADVFIEEKGAE